MSFAVLKGSELNQFLPLYLKLSAQKEKIYYLFSTTGKYRYVSCSLSSQDTTRKFFYVVKLH